MSNNKNKLSKAEQRKIEKMMVKKRNQKTMIMATIFIIVIIAAIYVVSMGNNSNQSNTEFTPVSDNYEQTETQIKIPVSSISYDASFYTYESNEVDIHYFAVKDDEGQVHVAIDACDVCYHAKEGYRQMENNMECVNCGLTFPIEDIGEKNTGGGCWPSFIPISIENENVLIQKSDLDSKGFMFQ